jgi:hypothetical protein
MNLEHFPQQQIERNPIKKDSTHRRRSRVPEYSRPVVRYSNDNAVASVSLVEAREEELLHPTEVFENEIPKNTPLSRKSEVVTPLMQSSISRPIEKIKHSTEKPDRENKPIDRFRKYFRTRPEGKIQRENRGFLRKLFGKEPFIKGEKLQKLDEKLQRQEDSYGWDSLIDENEEKEHPMSKHWKETE